jgi:hypothetical protein
MIRVSLSSLAVVLVVLMLGPVILLWIYGEWRRAIMNREASRWIAQCGMCGFQFRRETLVDSALVCPRCEAPVGGG